MKLKTKFQDKDFDLGEVVEGIISHSLSGKIEVTIIKGSGSTINYRYNSIKDFTDHWEDAPEEPKEYWYITEQATVVKMANNPKDIPNFVDRCSSIGNLFESKEEAEAAVEKLKAWQRLKEKGISLKLDSFRSCVDYRFDLRTLEDNEIVEISKDLVICFEGEE